jgi:hypothetical protein
MKSEDFKELQEFCELKGYQLLNESLEDNTKFFVVSKKIEKVKVEFSDFDYQVETGRKPKVTFEFFMPPTGRLDKVGKFLALKLEEYLNSDQK